MGTNRISKNRFRRAVMWAALALIILLVFLSVYGAFLGADGAKRFFNSVPLVVCWLVLTAGLIAGIAAFRRLVRVPGLLLIHVGCILILAGSMWGSNTAHKLRKQLLGIDKIQKADMIILEGCAENLVASENGESVKELPFSVKLKDFRIEYYKPEYLHVQTRQGRSWKIPVEIGSEFSLGPDLGTVKILKAFENFKITIDGGQKTAIDDPQAGFNPALAVQLKEPNGTITTKYVFERFPGFANPEDKLLLSYHRIIRDYISDLQIIKDDKVAVEKSIEVNRPLHFGGYHFYQHSYDAEAGQYTVLMVVSDTGLGFVYAGYLMLCAGVIWHLWMTWLVAPPLGVLRKESQGLRRVTGHGSRKNGN